MPVQENQKRTSDDGDGLKVWDVDSYHTQEGDASQHFQVGDLLERWADIVEEFGEKAGEFWEAFDEEIKRRDIPRLQNEWKLLSTNRTFDTRQREVRFVRRGPVAIAVLIARQGEDLYLSWRCFLKNKVLAWKVVALAAIAAFIGWPLAYDGALFTEASYHLVQHVIAGVVVFFLIVVLIAAYGFLRREGDLWSLLREQAHELQYDEVASLTTAVHKSLIHAADKVGIDSTKLEPREPVYLGRQRRRRM